MTASAEPNQPRALYRGRFAPSPTGPLHLGSLYTALAGFLHAKHQGGEWLLRIDDLDPHRTLPDSADRIRYALEACHLFWDEPVLYQSGRAEAYRAALDRLEAAGVLYPCSCSRKDLAHAAENAAPFTVYPGFCRRRRIRSEQGSHSLRIITEGIRIAFDDRLQGPAGQDLETEVGDFVLFRRDEVYAYHLATVLDDAEQGITEVLRGRDLLDSTPRQIYLQQQLGLPRPAYSHIPILVDECGLKLSKQTFAPEATVQDPGPLLFRLLVLLKQSPPPELASAGAKEILDWAIPNWEISRLQGLSSLPAAALQFPL